MIADVSIVIPCFNDQAWISDAIESCLGQTVAVREIIVVDDGSSDRTCEIVQGFGEKVRLIRSDHRGGAVARNIGWKAAQSRFIQFLDSDDLLYPDKIRIHYPLACSADPYKLPFCSAQVIEMDSGIIRYVSKHSLFEDPLEHVYFGLNSPILPLYPKSALLEIGGFTEGLQNCQDRDLNFRLWLQGYDLVPMEQALVTIRQRASSVSASVSKCLMNYQTVFEKATRCEGRSGCNQAKRLTARLFAGSARRLITMGQFRAAIRFHDIASSLELTEAQAVYGRLTRFLLCKGGLILANTPLVGLQCLKFVRSRYLELLKKLEHEQR